MRRGLTAALVATAVCVAAAGCSRGGSVASRPAPPQCAATQRPAIPLVIRLTTRPTAARAACIGRTYTNIVAPDWNGLPKQVHAVDPSAQLWQTRSLQYGFAPCPGCPQPGLDLADVERDHPEWILKDASGAPVHSPEHPTWVMYDISQPLYLQAWAEAAVAQLSSEGWTGVLVVDAGNESAWIIPPVDPATQAPMSDQDHARYLAQAMATVRGGLKTNGFSLIAENGPSSVIDSPQIGSSDAVSVNRGFATLTGGAWLALYRYFEAALDLRVGAWVWDEQPRLDYTQRVFGLASYLLVSGPTSAYGVNPAGQPALYQLNPGLPTEVPFRQDGVFMRAFDSGAVAVNPGLAPAIVTLPGETSSITIPAGGAVIDVKGALTTSYS